MIMMIHSRAPEGVILGLGLKKSLAREVWSGLEQGIFRSDLLSRL